MLPLRIISAVICFHTFMSGIFGADKYTDENRPYEFGFTIDGEQHRHEKKDENGIIMGEFGFITADGVYHVTVYATDENGRFKILSMKNIRVKPYPTAPVKKGHSLPFPPSENAPVTQGPATSIPQLEKKTEPINKLIASPVKSCSHCSLPTTTTKAPKVSDIAVVSKDRPAPNPISKPGLLPYNNPINQQNKPQLPNSVSAYGQSIPPSGLGQQNPPSVSRLEQNTPQAEIRQNYPQNAISDVNKNYPQSTGIANLNYPQQQSNDAKSNIYQNGNDANQYIQNRNQNSESPNYPQESSYENQNNPPKESNNYQKIPQEQSDNNYNNYAQQGPSFGQPQSGTELSNIPQSKIPQTPQNSLRNPKQYNDILPSTSGAVQPQGFRDIISLSSQANQPLDNKPTLVAAQMQIVPKTADIHHKHPGEQEGLPEGLSKDDMTQLLYTFNYSVGFHGHHEEGYRNGAKQGYYYVTGRNGVRTRVDYIADEKGYRPRISQEVLDLSSDDVPKAETEKDAKFGLKGYEFKWLYFPADDVKNK